MQILSNFTTPFEALYKARRRGLRKVFDPEMMILILTSFPISLSSSFVGLYLDVIIIEITSFYLIPLVDGKAIERSLVFII